MGMTTDYFVTTPERATALAETGPSGEGVPTLEMKWVEPAVLGGKLWATVEDAPFDADRFGAAGPMVALIDEGMAGVMQIADGFVEALASLPDERIATVAARWATAEEWMGPWDPGELDSTVLGLRDLAREVRTPDLHMYMWWSM